MTLQPKFWHTGETRRKVICPFKMLKHTDEQKGVVADVAITRLGVDPLIVGGVVFIIFATQEDEFWMARPQ